MAHERRQENTPSMANGFASSRPSAIATAHAARTGPWWAPWVYAKWQPKPALANINSTAAVVAAPRITIEPEGAKSLELLACESRHCCAERTGIEAPIA